MKFEDVYKESGEPVISTFFYDRLSYEILKIVRDWPITPNQITVLSFVLAIISSYYFYINSVVVGALFVVGFFVADCLDGQFARVNGMQSKFGDYLDHTFGTIFIYGIYFGICWNLEKWLAFLVLFSVVLYNYVVGISRGNAQVNAVRERIGGKFRQYIGFGFDIHSFIILVGALTGSFIYGLVLISIGCLGFSILRLLIVTIGAKNGN